MNRVQTQPVTWRLEIPGWRPALANELRGHWARGARLKARDRRAVATAAALAGVPLVGVPLADRKRRKALGLPAASPEDPEPRPRLVKLAITKPRGRPIDADAPLKSLLDALAACGLIVDDGPRWCRWEAPTFARGPLTTAIELADVE